MHDKMSGLTEKNAPPHIQYTNNPSQLLAIFVKKTPIIGDMRSKWFAVPLQKDERKRIGTERILSHEGNKRIYRLY